MQKIKNYLPVIALVCAVLAVCLSVFSLIRTADSAAKAEELELQNRYLQEQLNALSAAQDAVRSDAYCHLLVSDWEGSLSGLHLISATAQVVIPASAEQELLIQSAQLVLRQDIRELERRPVSLVASDSNTSFEAVLEDLHFELPELQENQQVDLWLEVVLSDGQILLSPACGWYRSGSELFMVAG